MTPKELKESIDLEEFLLGNGYSIAKKSTSKWPVYTNGNETLVINTKKLIKTYSITNGDRGTIIDFCMNRPEYLTGRTGSPLIQTLNFLEDYYARNNGTISHRKILSVQKVNAIFRPDLFEKSIDKTNKIFNYLRERGILTSTLTSPIFQNIGTYKHIDKYKRVFTNIGFPLYDQECNIVGMDLRNFDYKGMEAGSDKFNGIWLSNHFDWVNEIVIGESPIDLLSYHQLFNGKENAVLYISISGNLTIGELTNILSVINTLYSKNEKLKVKTAFDNDIDGLAYTTKVLIALVEQKVIFPEYHKKGYQKYSHLTSTKIRNSISGSTALKLIDLANYFEVIYPFTKKNLINLNQIIANCNDLFNVSVVYPKRKDFNEDLLEGEKLSSRSKMKNYEKSNINPLNCMYMEHFPVDKFPKDDINKLGLNFEKLIQNEQFIKAFGSGESVGPFNVSVTDVFGKTRYVPAKIRLVPKEPIANVFVEYASAYLNLKKLWNLNFSEDEQKFLYKYKELGKLAEIEINGKTLKGLVGIDEQLNILRFTPQAALKVYNKYLGVGLDPIDTLIIREGGMVYKENFTDSKTGELFNSVLYWSSTHWRVRFHSPTADLLDLCKKYYEQKSQSMIQSNVSQHIETNPAAMEVNQAKGMTLPF